ncbi:GntR family transcriptional regulator [Pandoraea sp. PE-S2R-1]|uniref:GntR family transcriptional regulator n=1 Tax=Pandoraea sp. PE-S2R-1 TaxID=1986994 RepID=UPI000B403791|nr:GntR family transcriptional regulator [Pandoraea sp. PE-S2R-1]
MNENNALLPEKQGPASSAHSIAAQVYASLKADIFDFRLLPGDRFSEGDVATRMQISRTPVRQALFWLQREGYVDVHFKSGWQVRAFDFKYFEDLYEIRIVMESAAIARIIEGAMVPSLAALRAIWCVAPEQREADPATVASLDEAFHAGLVTATGNIEMSRMHQDVTERIRIIRRLDFTKVPRIAATYEEHAAILDAIQDGNVALAQSRIKAHIAESQAEVKRITLYMLQSARQRYAADE